MCIWRGDASCPVGRRMMSTALAYGAARVDTADAGDVGCCRGRLHYRASSTHTWGGLRSIGQWVVLTVPAAKREGRGGERCMTQRRSGVAQHVDAHWQDDDDCVERWTAMA
jgi:hypothetical protein